MHRDRAPAQHFLNCFHLWFNAAVWKNSEGNPPRKAAMNLAKSVKSHSVLAALEMLFTAFRRAEFTLNWYPKDPKSFLPHVKLPLSTLWVKNGPTTTSS